MPSSSSTPAKSMSSNCRRLTRQRKLRHVSDDDLGLHIHSSETECCLSSSDTSRKSRSAHWSSSAVPLPLPLPELTTCATARRDSDHGVTSSAKLLRKFYTRVSHNPNFEGASYNLRVEVPVRSAPSSPSASPRGLETRASSHDVDAKGSNCNYRPNACNTSDLTDGYLAPFTPRRTDAGDLSVPTFTGSPVWNNLNRNSHLNSTSLNASPLHHCLLQESNKEWLHAHPLPLPPRALVPSQSFVPPQSRISHHGMEKADASPMKNQWKKGKLIGRGTFASVYVGSNRETGALCAMKQVDLVPDEPKAAECIKQLEQEIKVLGQLKHPNIVQYYGSEIVDDHFYIYLEYVYPGSINKYVHEHVGDMTESVVRNFTRHILSGLVYLHSTKTVHRDIKGANLLVDATGVVKLADFGMAKLLTGQASLLSLKGSPHWMAPEGIVPKNANPDIAFALDIWSLGCTVIEMLTGKPPWNEFEGAAAMFKVLHGSPPIPETLSSEGKDFLWHCFRRNPAERPSASKLLEHPFLQNLHDQNTPASMQTFSGFNLMDRPLSPRGTRAMHASPQRDGRKPHCQECYAETSDDIIATCQPSSCMVEVLPCPAQLHHFSRNFSPSSQPPSHIHFGAVNNHPCAPSRTHRREVSHL